MNLRPLHDRIVLRRLEPAPDGKLIVEPDSAKEKSTLCQVVAVGPGKYLERHGKTYFQAMTLKPGEKVIIGQYNDLEIEGENLLICMEADVRAVIDG